MYYISRSHNYLRSVMVMVDGSPFFKNAAWVLGLRDRLSGILRISELSK